MGSYSLLELDRPIIFFDDNCLLCNRSVQILLKIDRKQLFLFSALSSDLGDQMVSLYSVDDDSVILYDKGVVNIKSKAFLKICKLLRFPYSLMLVFYVVPSFIGDWIYDIIANNRRRWFGNTSSCILDENKYSNRIVGNDSAKNSSLNQ